MATSMPGPALAGVPIWDMNGTLAEVYPPQSMEAARQLLAPYVGRHVLIRIEGLNHSIVNRPVRMIGPVWLQAIASGFFDPSWPVGQAPAAAGDSRAAGEKLVGTMFLAMSPGPSPPREGAAPAARA